MNNWEYVHNTPTLQEDFNGMDSIVRQIELKHESDKIYHLVSQPIDELNELTTSTDSYEQIEVNGSETLDVTVFSEGGTAIFNKHLGSIN